jgi:cell division protein FtsZ
MDNDIGSRFSFDDAANEEAKICVVGVGGGGGNAINNMAQKGIHGSVEFVAINTDAQALAENQAPQKIQAGRTLTKGLGAGARPGVGAEAIDENSNEIEQAVEGYDMVFITAGMGGGTGTGGAPVVASIARNLDILTVAIVTKPFECEGARRMKTAREGIQLLRENVDTLIVIPNERLLDIADENTSLIEAFAKADEVLYNATRGISDLITVHGLINLDFADVKTTMKNGGTALMGAATATGENRAEKAATQAISSPLLDGLSIAGARNVLVNITSGSSLGIREATTATGVIQREAGDDVEVIFGTVIDDNMDDKLRVTVIATGFDDEDDETQHPSPARSSQQQRHSAQQSTSPQQQSASQQPAQQQPASQQPASQQPSGSQPEEEPSSSVRRTRPLDGHGPNYNYKGEDNLRHLDTPAYERRSTLRSRPQPQPPKQQDAQEESKSPEPDPSPEPEPPRKKPKIRRLRSKDEEEQASRGRSTSEDSSSSSEDGDDSDTPAFLRKMMD